MASVVSVRHLFGPGLCNHYPEATVALCLPRFGHLDPAFIARMDLTCAGSRTLWGTEYTRTLPLSATGPLAPGRQGAGVIPRRANTPAHRPDTARADTSRAVPTS